MPITATVVVPTFRRPAGLARVLDALARQHEPGVAWDVVVVDNDDAPGAEPVFAEQSARLPVPARLVRERQRGASPTRNRGVAEASGTVIAFLDDDVVPADDWLLLLLAPILAGRCQGVGGRVVLDPTVPRPSWFDEPGLAGYLAAHDPADRERPLEPAEFVITRERAAFDAALFRATGGFDPELGPREGVQLVNDDVLVTDRFRDLGGIVHHVPEAVVVHELPADRLRPRYLLRRAYTQGRSDLRYQVRTIGRRGAVEHQLQWYGHEVGCRFREGMWRRPVLFHAACDLARLAGWVRDAALVTLRARGRTAGGGKRTR